MIGRHTSPVELRPDDVIAWEDQLLFVDEVTIGRTMVAIACYPEHRREGHRIVARVRHDDTVWALAKPDQHDICIGMLAAALDTVARSESGQDLSVKLCPDALEVGFPGGWVWKVPRAEEGNGGHGSPAPGPEADPVAAAGT